MFVIYNVIIFYCRQVVTHLVKIKPGAPQIILTVIDIYKKKGGRNSGNYLFFNWLKTGSTQ